MYITTRKIQNENRAIATRHPNRAPTVAPISLLEVAPVEVELEVLLAEVEPVEIGLVEALVAETGLVFEVIPIIIKFDAGLAVGVVSHWPMTVHVENKNLIQAYRQCIYLQLEHPLR